MFIIVSEKETFHKIVILGDPMFQPPVPPPWVIMSTLFFCSRVLCFIIIPPPFICINL